MNVASGHLGSFGVYLARGFPQPPTSSFPNELCFSEGESVIETRCRADLVCELRMHNFRGIVQMRRDIRLPLADIYLAKIWEGRA